LEPVGKIWSRQRLSGYQSSAGALPAVAGFSPASLPVAVIPNRFSGEESLFA